MLSLQYKWIITLDCTKELLHIWRKFMVRQARNHDVISKLKSWVVGGGGGAGINYILSSVHIKTQVYRLKEGEDQGYDLSFPVFGTGWSLLAVKQLLTT